MAVLITLFSMGNVSASAAAKVAGSVKDPDGSKCGTDVSQCDN